MSNEIQAIKQQLALLTEKLDKLQEPRPKVYGYRAEEDALIIAFSNLNLPLEKMEGLLPGRTVDALRQRRKRLLDECKLTLPLGQRRQYLGRTTWDAARISVLRSHLLEGKTQAQAAEAMNLRSKQIERQIPKALPGPGELQNWRAAVS